MTKEQQIIAVAKLDGFNPVDTYGPNKPITEVTFVDKAGEMRQLDCDYLTSRDTIVPVRIKVCNTIELKVKWLNFAREILAKKLKRVVSDFDVACIEPDDDTEALLRATGEWKE
jgi:hypothetical protein